MINKFEACNMEFAPKIFCKYDLLYEWELNTRAISVMAPASLT